MLHRTVLLIAVAMAFGVTAPANANVVINMPPPTKAAMTISTLPPAAPASSPSASKPASTSTVGDVALWRFARARNGTYDTYFRFNPRYNNFYPYDNWGNSWFFGYPFFFNGGHGCHTSHNSCMPAIGMRSPCLR